MKAPLLQQSKESSRAWGIWFMFAMVLSLCLLVGVKHKMQLEEAVGGSDVADDVEDYLDTVEVEIGAEGEAVACVLTRQRGIELTDDAKLEGCTTSDCSNPVLTGATCSKTRGLTGTVVLDTPFCSADDPEVRLGGCTGIPCQIPAVMPQGYALIDPSKPATVEDCTSAKCGRKAKITNIGCASGYYLRYKKLFFRRCKPSHPAMMFMGCDVKDYSFNDPIVVEPPAPCLHQDKAEWAIEVAKITPCMCGNTAAGGTAVRCDEHWAMCVVDAVTNNGMCTRKCKKDSDCGAGLKCKNDLERVRIPHEEETMRRRRFFIGKCVNQEDQVVDYRAAGIPELSLHPAITPETNALFQLAMNLDPASSTVPANTAYVYVWARTPRGNPGHASVAYNSGAGLKYVSHWPGDYHLQQLTPRHEINPEGKLPDVIFKMENLVFNVQELEAAETKILTVKHGMWSTNCAWAVKKILHCTDFPIGKHFIYPWTPHVVHKKLSGLLQYNIPRAQHFNLQLLMRPDMTEQYYKDNLKRRTDPQLGIFGRRNLDDGDMGDAEANA